MTVAQTDTQVHAEFLAAAAEARAATRDLDAQLMGICRQLYPILERVMDASVRVGTAHRALCAIEGRDPESYPLEHREAMSVPDIPALRIARMDGLLRALIYYPHPDPQPADPRGT